MKAVAGLCALASFAGACGAQLRVANWNISFYSGGRAPELQSVIYGVYQGRSMSPDVIATQEFSSDAARLSFLAILNTAPGSPGDWAAAPFVDGADSEGCLFYRTSKASLVGGRTWTIGVGSSDPNNQPRNTYRYDLRLAGYTSAPATLAVYNVHMKAGSASSDNARRLVEAQRIRDNAQGIDTNGAGSAMPAGFMFLVAGDMNMQQSTQSSYQEFIASQPNNAGRFFDPISTPGSWNNNGAFRIVHTQDPAGAGGVDDRHDQILVSAGLVDGSGFEYIGAYGVPYSPSTWNDPNHSYRCWGNDGTSFDTTLTVAGNTMVGPAIAQALINAASGAGHLPVYLDFRVPPEVSAPVLVDFGAVPVGSLAQVMIDVGNAGDVPKWTVGGVSALNYSLQASPGFGAPGGAFVDAPGGALNAHAIVMDTSSPGVVNGTLVISSNAPDTPSVVVALVGEVVAPACPADFNADGQVDFFDYDDFVSCFEGGACPPGRSADFNNDAEVDFFDYDDFIIAFEEVC